MEIRPRPASGIAPTFTSSDNPAGQPLDITVDGAMAEGRITYDDRFEGAPGLVHGGHVAAAMDHLAGVAASQVAQPILTGRLNIRYLAPTRLARPIRFQADVTEKVHTLVRVHVRAYDAETVTADARAVFMKIARPRMDELLAGDPGMESDHV